MIQLVLASDRNLIRQAGLTAMSAVATASLPVHVTFVTPSAEADDERWRTVTRLLESRGASATLAPVSLDATSLSLADHLTPAAYYRLLLPELLPESMQRAIYLDCDILVRRDLAELWTTDLQGCPVGAVEDVAFNNWDRLGLSPEHPYFNSGVLLLDLDRIRRTDVFRAALAFARTHPASLTWSDQCALNKVLHGNWIPLDRHWNYNHVEFLRDARRLGIAGAVAQASDYVIHYNNWERPWLFESAHPLKGYYADLAGTWPELGLPVKGTLRSCWPRVRRAVKWAIARVTPRSVDLPKHLLDRSRNGSKRT